MRKIFLVLTLLFVLYPFVVGTLASISINNEIADGFHALPINGKSFTLDNYKNITNNKPILYSLIYTFTISLISSIVIVFISFLIGFFISRSNNIWIAPSFLALYIYSIPSIFYATLFIFSGTSLLLVSLQFVISHFYYLFPFVLLLAVNYLNYVPLAFDMQAAMDGTSTIYLIKKIIYPYFRPVLLALFLIVFIIIFNDVLFSTFIAKSEKYRFIGHYVIENIYNPDQKQFRFAEISAYGLIISFILTSFSSFILFKYSKYLNKELKNNI